MNRAVDSLSTTANRIAQSGSAPAGSTSSNAIGGDTVSLSSDMVSLMNARTSFEANAKTAEVSDQTTRYALDMFA
jgi:flagellar hook protein FlgE